MHIGDAAPARTACCRSMEGFVWRALEEQIQCMKRSMLFMRRALAVDLLKTDHIGAQSFELWPKNIRPLLDCDSRPRQQIQAFKIEGRNTHGLIRSHPQTHNPRVLRPSPTGD